MKLRRLLTIISTYVLLGSSVLAVVISGTSYGKYKIQDDLLSYDVDLAVLYGIGLGISLLCFVLLWIFLAFPHLKFHYFVTFPLLYLLPATYIYFSWPGYAEKYLEKWDGNWDQDSLYVENLQMTYRCCGWKNVTDRGLYPCPFDFESGCYQTILTYMSNVSEWNLIASSCILVLSLMSSIVLFVLIGKNSEKSVLACIQVA